MFRPVMRMGLIGFEDDTHLRELLSLRAATCQWERGPFIEADALWANGEHAQLVRGRFVRVPSYDPTRPATLLNLKEVDRPMAFTLPLPNPDVIPPAVFNPYSADSVDAILTKFEAWLLPLAAELALAQRLAELRFSLTSPVYHLALHHELVGVVDLEGDVGLLPGITPGQVAAAEWCGRPAGAHAIPGHFSRSSIAQVMWQFSTRTQEDLLPPRYRQVVIYFRGPPRVPQRLLRDSHMLLLGQLNSRPQDLAQLQASTGLSEREVAYALAALYFAGSITTHRGKTAWVPRSATAPTRVASPGPGVPSSLLDDDPHEAGHRPAPDLTVPAALEMRPRY
ncbi:MAG: hypothetical protein HY854_21930 [Burkholderiales bacterium]|nr:hypothetical protein [Burkholderiales bacterium]